VGANMLVERKIQGVGVVVSRARGALPLKS
jgi:hypothetical protein